MRLHCISTLQARINTRETIDLGRADYPSNRCSIAAGYRQGDREGAGRTGPRVMRSSIFGRKTRKRLSPILATASLEPRPLQRCLSAHWGSPKQWAREFGSDRICINSTSVDLKENSCRLPLLPRDSKMRSAIDAAEHWLGLETHRNRPLQWRAFVNRASAHRLASISLLSAPHGRRSVTPVSGALTVLATRATA